MNNQNCVGVQSYTRDLIQYQSRSDFSPHISYVQLRLSNKTWRCYHFNIKKTQSPHITNFIIYRLCSKFIIPHYLYWGKALAYFWLVFLSSEACLYVSYLSSPVFYMNTFWTLLNRYEYAQTQKPVNTRYFIMEKSKLFSSGK